MRYARACLPLLMCLLATLAGCGSPLTGIYAENQGQISYVLVFRAAGFFPVSKALSANSQGNVFQERVDVIGEVQLLTTDCQVVSTASAGPGNVLISVVDGQLKVVSGVDLSGRPANFLGDEESCPTEPS